MGDRTLPLRSILKNHYRTQESPKPSVAKPSVPEPSGPDPRVPSEQFWPKPSPDVYLTVQDLKRGQQEIERLKLDYADLEEQATNWNALLEQEIEAKTRLQKERKKGVKIISELQEQLAKERRELSELKAWKEKWAFEGAKTASHTPTASSPHTTPHTPPASTSHTTPHAPPTPRSPTAHHSNTPPHPSIAHRSPRSPYSIRASLAPDEEGKTPLGRLADLQLRMSSWRARDPQFGRAAFDLMLRLEDAFEAAGRRESAEMNEVSKLMMETALKEVEKRIKRRGARREIDKNEPVEEWKMPQPMGMGGEGAVGRPKDVVPQARPTPSGRLVRDMKEHDAKHRWL